MTFLGPDTTAILVSAGCAAFVLVAGGVLTEISPWYVNLRKPSWQPPGWAFAPAWTLIAVATAASAVLAWNAAPGARAMVAGLFALNSVLNIAWSLFFFKLRRPDWALADIVPLWLSIVALLAAFAPYSAAASWLLLPYLLWVSFAAGLNLVIVWLNQPFQGLAAHRKLGARG